MGGVEERVGISRRLREAKIEAAARGAGDVCQHAIEHPPVALVPVEAVVKERAQKTAALRNPETVGAFQKVPLVTKDGDIVSAVLQKRDYVTHRGRSQPHEH